MFMPAIWILAIAVVAVAVIGVGSSSPLQAHRASATNFLTSRANNAREMGHPSAPATAAQQSRVHATMRALPLAFEANQGQTDPQVKYMARGNGYKLYLTSSQAILRVSGRHGDSDVRDMMMNKRRGAAATKAWVKKHYGNARSGSSQAEVRMNLLGPGAEAKLSANEPQQAKLNYFI